MRTDLYRRNAERLIGEIPQGVVARDLLGTILEKPHLLRAEICRRSFAEFVREMWDTIIPEKLVWNFHMDVMCNELQFVAERVFQNLPKLYDLVINVPPGTSKSTIAVQMFPAWCWTRAPWTRHICGSYSGPLALEHADLSRDILKSNKYQLYYPEVEIRVDRDNKTSFRNNKGGTRFSTSVGGTVTGTHGHFLIVDDPLNPRKAASPAERQSAIHWMRQTLSTRKVNKAVALTILVMQRLAEDDPSGDMLGDDKWKTKHICLPGEITTIRNSKGEQERVKVSPPELEKYYHKDEHGNLLLDPVRMPKPVLEELEGILGQYGYAQQILQEASPPSGGMFRTNQFVLCDKPPAKVTKKVRYWDKAGTQDGGKFTAGVLMGELEGIDPKKPLGWIVLDVQRGQWRTEIREQNIKRQAELDGVETTVYIEQEPGSGGKESAESTIKNLASFVVYKDRPVGDKIFRADPYSVQVNNGNVYVLNREWTRPFLDEHRFFPVGKFSDQVDGASGAFAKLAGKTNRAGALGKHRKKLMEDQSKSTKERKI